MGVRASTLVGRSVVDERLRGFTSYDENRIKSMLIAHRHDLGGRLALGPKHAIVLLRLPEEDVLPIFHEIFDTDKNGLVDAFELMSAVMMLSRMPIKAKVNRLHGLFDFNLSGELTIDELTIFFRTVAAACGKMDPNVKPPKIAALEDVTRWAFRKANRSTDGELTKLEFDRFVFTDPAIAHFLAYFNEASGQVLIPDGAKFEDDGVAVYFDPGAPPAGLPGVGATTWKRPEAFMIATPKLFKDEAAFGKLVPGALSDLWFLSAVAILMASPNSIRKLFVATGQEDPEGRFAVQFYRCGVATQVCVDDRVPVDVGDKPFFSRTDDPCELWLLLVEKAFALHHGAYEILRSGRTADALRTLTGGTVFEHDLRALDEDALCRVETNQWFGSARRNLETRLSRSKRGLFGSFLETECSSLRPRSPEVWDRSLSPNPFELDHVERILNILISTQASPRRPRCRSRSRPPRSASPAAPRCRRSSGRRSSRRATACRTARRATGPTRAGPAPTSRPRRSGASTEARSA